MFNELVAAEVERRPGFDRVHMMGPSHNGTDPIEILMVGAMTIQRAYTHALVVDREALAAHQQSNVAPMATTTLRRAYETDVRPWSPPSGDRAIEFGGRMTTSTVPAGRRARPRRGAEMTTPMLDEMAVATITGYHAHVYYDAATRPAAEDLREALAARFDVELGRWHDAPVGPHPTGSYQVAFRPELFGALIPWLALNRRGLTVFVHPETGDDVADHSRHVIWLGESREIDLSVLE
ncbi:MAG: DOPA 4,5-dioxygenase family protein [Alphaproteobacteria bacterium]